MNIYTVSTKKWLDDNTTASSFCSTAEVRPAWYQYVIIEESA